jgi:hypothetical protein
MPQFQSNIDSSIPAYKRSAIPVVAAQELCFAAISAELKRLPVLPLPFASHHRSEPDSRGSHSFAPS